MECQYCKNVFSTKTSLNNHQRTAKYCLKLRGKTSEYKYKCDSCNMSFHKIFNLNRHMESCKASDKVYKYIEINKKLSDEIREKDIIIKQQAGQLLKNENVIKELQDKLENIAIRAVERPTSTTNNMKTNINNFIQNMQPVTTENLLEHTEHLTLEHVQKGASGYAEYALEYPFKDRIACVDYSRRKIKFKDSEGHLVTDPEMVKLAPMFFNSIKDKSSQLVYSQNDPNMDSVMFEQVAKLFNTNADVKNGSSGIKSDFYHDFIKHVCSGSLVD